MRSTILLLAGVSIGLACLLLSRRANAAGAVAGDAGELAHKLQDAWADHHTVA